MSESLEASPASHMSKHSRASYSESVPSSPSQEQNGGRCNVVVISATFCYFCQFKQVLLI